MTGPGFAFRYRLVGAAHSVIRFRQEECKGLRPGDMATFRSHKLVPASSGDDALVGIVLHPDRDGAYFEVVTDADAVYGVTDPYERKTGATLDLTGNPGEQGVQTGPNEDFQVVIGCSAEEETLLRITIGRHHEFAVALRADSSRSGLRPVQERQVVAAAAAGDPRACRELVEAFMPAISSVARLYRNAAGVGREELLQEGVVGLLRALSRFDPGLGTPFWAYASWWVRQAMQQVVSELTRPAVLSDRAQRGLARVRDARSEHQQAHAQEPSSGDLAASTGLPREQVESLLAVERAPRGLEEPHVHDDGPPGTLEEAIADPEAENEYQYVIDRMEIDEVRGLTAGLDDRERSILRDHYGLGGPPRTLREIGERLGLSAERVRQIEEETLARLRSAVALGHGLP